VQPEFAALPHFERPFAARGTVWELGADLVSAGTSVEAAAADLALSGSGGRALERGDPEQEPGDPEAHPLPLPAEAAGDASGGSPQLVQSEALPRSGRWIALTAANAVLLLAAASAVTLVVHHDQAAQAARIDRPSVTARPSSSGSPTLGRPGSNELRVAPAAATAPNEAAIAASLTRYFDAINNHDYLVYKRTFIQPLRRRITPTSFTAEFGTAAEMDEELHSITAIGADQADAFVTFVSQQRISGHPGSSACTVWSMEFYLGRRGSRYLFVAPPQWYQAADTGCS